MADAARLDDPDNWAGGHYELDIELGDAGKLPPALTALWAGAGADGCFRRATGGPVSVPLTAGSLARHGHLAGVATLPSGRRTVCGCFAARYDDDRQWLNFYLPVGALARTDRRVGGPGSLSWRRAIDDWLASVAEAVHRAVGIECARIGFELDAGPDAAELRAAIPAERWEAVVLPGPTGLVYTPANR